ncbi:MAG TPA: sporulation protein YabP [Clostridiales bacterium]|nr:sporulation protein YabP [Clostridiales bacterium]
MEERKIGKSRNQNIVLENREKLSVSGVEHVTSFNEDTVVMETTEGILTIKGSDLDMNRLNLDDGNVTVQGRIYAILYSDSSSGKGMGFLGRMFK